MKRTPSAATLLAAALTLSALAPAHGAPVPDFSGVWAHNTIDYLPPKSGPGPVKNISGSARMMVGDYNNPILKPWAAKIVKAKGDISRTGMSFPTAHNQCWPEPPPYIMGNQELQMLQKPDEVVLMYSHGGQVRHVRLNVPHPEHVTPSWYGDSVGHYEGNTLVVDTIGVSVKPLSSLDRYGTPHTDALHVVERYHLIDPNSTTAELRPARSGFRESGDDIIDRGFKGPALQIDFTVEDPGAFTTAWSGTAIYRRGKGRFIEDVCAENVHDYITGRDSKVPQANTTQFSSN
jgi:hypothetical protein